MKIGIVTDIHENALMLKESLKNAERHRCDEMACLGDIAGYDKRFFSYDSLRSASECVRLIRDNFKWVVAGNHDLFAAGRFPVYSNGFSYPLNWFAMNPAERKEISAGRVWCFECDAPNDLDDEGRSFLGGLPEYEITTEPGLTCLFSHYFFPDFTGSTTMYIERKGHLRQQWKFMEDNDIAISFSGHSHNHFAGFAYKDTGSFLKAIHSFPNDSFNLGKEMAVILLPPLSGEKSRTGFSILDTDEMKLRIVYI